MQIGFETTLTKENVLMFYGKWKVGVGFLSNFCLSSMNIEGLCFATVEHYYQFKKVQYFRGDELARCILSMQTSAQAKRKANSLVSNVHKRILEQWKLTHGLLAMKLAVREKFVSNPGLAISLLATRKTVLVHTHQTETLWGVAMDDNTFGDWLAEQKVNIVIGTDVGPENVNKLSMLGRGKNVLGYILMWTREELRGRYSQKLHIPVLINSGDQKSTCYNQNHKEASQLAVLQFQNLPQQNTIQKSQNLAQQNAIHKLHNLPQQNTITYSYYNRSKY